MIRQKAFSLMELLIAIAIISFLSSMIFPALWKGREAGRKSLCMSNLHQIGMALEMFYQDSNKYPEADRFSYDGANSIITYLSSYVGIEVFKCPTNKELNEAYGVSYVYNDDPDKDDGWLMSCARPIMAENPHLGMANVLWLDQRITAENTEWEEK